MVMSLLLLVRYRIRYSSRTICYRNKRFCPGLCLKTTLHGGYSNLTSVYTKQCEWAEQNGYENNGPLYEVYITDPTQTSNEDDLVTEIYYPVKKK